MKPGFALDLSHHGIGLLRRTKGGWQSLGEVALDAQDMAEQLAALRRTAADLEKGGLTTKLLIPADQILYTEVEAPGTDEKSREEKIGAALDGLTPYRLEEISFDWAPLKGDRVAVAAVARETLAEAEKFATEHRFNAVSFASVPAEGKFPREPFFGTAGAASDWLGNGETVEREDEPVRIISTPPGSPDHATSLGEKTPVAAVPEPETAIETVSEDEDLPPPDPSHLTRQVEDAPQVEGVDDPGVTDLFEETATPQTEAGPDTAAGSKKSKARLFAILGILAVAAIAIAYWIFLVAPSEEEQATALPLAEPELVAEEGTSQEQDIVTEAPTELSPPDLAVTTAPPEIAPQPSALPNLVPTPEELAEAAESEVLPTDLEAAVEPAETREDAAIDFAITGIRTMLDPQPSMPQVDYLEGLVIARSVPPTIGFDAVALPSETGFDHDRRPTGYTPPPPPGTTFEFGDNGLVIATEDGALTPDGITVFASRPPLQPPERPTTLVLAADPDAVRIAAIRPRARPANPQLAERIDGEPTGAAVLSSLVPRTRPQGFSQTVQETIAAIQAEEARRSEEADGEPEVTSAAVRTPSIPTSASVARTATLENVMNLREINLIGIFGTSSSPRALVRMPTGRLIRVGVGDRLDGGQVAAIGNRELAYIKNGRTYRLTIPE
ncbi:MAG: hypothetical protein HUJ27_04445 [Rhodobacteraceae bacterium]|nr:hypothetical protein [Paracoccaceae bacterium]